MKKLYLAIALALVAVYARAGTDRPDAILAKASNDLLAIARSDTAIKNGDVHRVRSLVEQNLVPLMDFERMTSLAAGTHWRAATTEQRRGLTASFEKLLVNTYAATLSQLRDKTISFSPLRADSGEDDDVVVHSKVVGSDNHPLDMDYRMEKRLGQWKVYDVNILGVWLVETYKGSFHSEIERSGIDGLIHVLEEKNKRAG